jgi:hypothetical protein
MVDGAKSGAAAGLVTSGTSHTRSHGTRYRTLSGITPEMQRRKRLLRMRKNTITGARLAVSEAQQGGFRGRWGMLTLTYRDDIRWVAKQISALLTIIRNYAARCGFKARYVWCLELTKRGRPHYHVLVWLPKGRTLPKPDKQGWWQHGLTKIEWARNAVGYLAKYASKGDDYCLKTIPSGARLCGNGGISKDGRTELRWWNSPTWVRAIWPEICDVGRTTGGYVQRSTGEYLRSPWRVVFSGGGLVLCEAVHE